MRKLIIGLVSLSIVLVFFSSYAIPIHAAPNPAADGNPFGGTALAVPGKIEAENYNTGGEGIAYHDTTAGNTGNVYRTDGVDIEATTDTGGGFNVGWTATGEWTKFTVNVATTGTYTLDFRVASANTGSTFHLEVDGANVTGTLTVPNTGGWQAWQTVTKTGVSLSAGAHLLRLFVDTGGMNFNWINLTLTSGGGEAPFGGNRWAVPGLIEAENYDTGGEGVAYHDLEAANQGGQYRTSEGVDVEATTDTGGGFNIGYTATGEWTKYMVNIAQTNLYTFQFRVASLNTGSTFHLEVDGTNVTGTLTVPNTGGWQTWQTVTKTGVNLSAGQHVFRWFVDNGGMNFNSVRLSSTSGPTVTPGGTFVPPTNTASPVPTSGGTAPAWDCSKSYNAGDQVSYQGHIYKALVAVPPGECGWIPGSTPTVWQDMGTGGSGTPTRTPSPFPTTVGGGGKVFAPYIDVSPGSGSAIMQLASNGSGNKHYTLAFILGAGCNASWFGSFPMNTTEADGIGSRINELRAAGGDVIVSFGGAAAPELADVCTTVSSLQAQYQAVVSKYGLNTVDFDIEDFPPAAIDLRNKALKGLEAANPNLKVHYTLGVLQSGFTQSQNDVLNNAKSNGTRVDLVNIMVMDYGATVSDMSAAAISAAQAARGQLNSMGFGSTQLGLTPMIGVNDSPGETFSLANASSLVSWANSNNIQLIGFWSVGRDNGGCPGGGSASATCSGVSQSNFQFSSIFHGFAN